MISSILVLFTMSCLPLFSFHVPENKGLISLRRDPASVFRSVLQMWESGNLSQFNEIIAGDDAGHVASGMRDREGLRARIQAFHKLYPDIHFNIEDQFGQGDKLVTRMRALGTNSDTGAKTELMGINISRIVKGKLAEEWATWEPIAAR